MLVILALLPMARGAILPSGGQSVSSPLDFEVPSNVQGWTLLSGGCSTYETESEICVTDGRDTHYDNDETCTFAYVGEATLSWATFDIFLAHYRNDYDDYGYNCISPHFDNDYLVIDDEVFCGAEEPNMEERTVDGYTYLFGSADTYRPSSESFDVTGTTRFMFKAQIGKGESRTQTENAGFDICAPKPATGQEDFASLDDLKTHCSSIDNCVACGGKYSKGMTKCHLKKRKMNKCNTYNNAASEAVCNRLPGCVWKQSGGKRGNRAERKGTTIVRKGRCKSNGKFKTAKGKKSNKAFP